MRELSKQEKRTIRIAAIGIGIYLFLFLGFQGWKLLEKTRAEYAQLENEAAELRTRLKPYEERALVVEKLMGEFHLDPAKLSKETVVANASAAIQKAAMGSGVGLGPVRESHGRSSTREVATIQMQANGQLPGVLSFLQRLPTLGFPLIVESAQITAGPGQPGMLSVNLTITILDFDQWKKAGVPHA